MPHNYLPKVKSQYDSLPYPPCNPDDDRKRRRRGQQLRQEREAVVAAEAQVQERQFDGGFLHLSPRGGGRAGLDDGVPRRLQCGSERAADGRLVVDHENSHAGHFARSAGRSARRRAEFRSCAVEMPLHSLPFRVRHPTCFPPPVSPEDFVMMLLFVLGLALIGLMAAFAWFCDRV